MRGEGRVLIGVGFGEMGKVVGRGGWGCNRFGGWGDDGWVGRVGDDVDASSMAHGYTNCAQACAVSMTLVSLNPTLIFPLWPMDNDTH